MSTWPDRRLLDLFGIDLPIIQAPMAGATTVEMVIAVSRAGGLGSLPCAMLSPEQARDALGRLRDAAPGSYNLNFFCHTPPEPDAALSLAWRARLAPYYAEQGLDAEAPVPVSARRPFDAEACALVEEFRPAVVSFHFGLPAPDLLGRVKASGTVVIASATTVAEARWLVERGCDAVIAMGYEAGGHRGNFLDHDMATQVGTFALVPQVVDAVPVPVIAAGGIADGRGVAAALTLGAAGVQIGTAYLRGPEARIPEYHRAALAAARDDGTMVTNLFTGRPARGLANRLMREQGPLSSGIPPFPLAGGALTPLRARTEAAGSGEFSNMWAGQAAALARPLPAADLTRLLAAEALARLGRG